MEVLQIVDCRLQIENLLQQSTICNTLAIEKLILNLNQPATN
jgi:hypothetical protein